MNWVKATGGKGAEPGRVLHFRPLPIARQRIAGRPPSTGGRGNKLTPS
jgi:hypothetical protein